MTPSLARLWHLPMLLNVLWSFTRTTDWLPRRRGRWDDLWLMGKIICRGWVRHLNCRGFIARDRDCIHALFVHPSSRGCGVGQALLEDAKAKSDRLELWVFAQNTSARQFYTAQGFSEVLCSKGMGNDEDLPDILMVWRKPHPELKGAPR